MSGINARCSSPSLMVFVILANFITRNYSTSHDVIPFLEAVIIAANDGCKLLSKIFTDDDEISQT